MEKRSVTLPGDRVESLEARVDAGEFDSFSEALRERLAVADALEDRVDQLESEVEHAKARAREAEANAKHARETAREERETTEELVPLVEDARDSTNELRAREAARRQASIVARAKWALLGEPADLPERVDAGDDGRDE